MKFDTIPAALRNLIETKPDSPLVKGFCRSLLSVVPPPGSSKEDIIKLIEEKGELKAKPLPMSSSRREETRDVHFTLDENEWGTCRYYVSVHRDGEMSVPVDIIEEGWEAVEDYIRDNYYDYDGDYGDYNYENYEQTDTDTNEFTTNAEDVCEEYEEENEE